MNPFVLAFLLVAPPQTMTARVVGVHDGDTITVLIDSARQEKIRLAGIDAPELGQPFGTRAKQALSERVAGRDVRIVWRSKDRYGRILGDIHLGERWINREMVEAGMAWQYVRFDRSRALGDAQLDAFEAERGLWFEREPVAPWVWRQSRSVRPAAGESSGNR